MITVFLISLLLASCATAPIPQLNAALSTYVVNNQISKFAGPLIQQTLKNYNITQNFTLDQGTLLSATIYDIKIDNIGINWVGEVMTVNTDYDFSVNAKNVNLSLSMKVLGHQSIRKIHANITAIITKLDLNINIQFINSLTNLGVGFAIAINHIDYDDQFQLDIKGDAIDSTIIHLVLRLIRSSIPSILNKAVQNRVNPLIAEMMSKRAYLQSEVGKYLYQFDINTTSVPKFVNKTFLSIPLNIQINNTITSKANPEIQNQQLPVKSFPDHIHDAEATISSGFINTLVWLVEDSQIIDVVLNNTSLGADPPINLNTTDLTILMPELPLKTGKNKGVYVHVTSSTKVPQVYIRNGRLIASLSVNVQFIVDGTNHYPNNNITTCLAAQQCISATTLNVSLVTALSIKTDNKNYLFGNLQVVKIESIQTYQDSFINVNTADLKLILNSLVGSFLPPVNNQLRDGMPLPVSMLFGYNITNVNLQTSLDYLSAGVIFDFK